MLSAMVVAAPTMRWRRWYLLLAVFFLYPQVFTLATGGTILPLASSSIAVDFLASLIPMLLPYCLSLTSSNRTGFRAFLVMVLPLLLPIVGAAGFRFVLVSSAMFSTRVCSLIGVPTVITTAVIPTATKISTLALSAFTTSMLLFFLTASLRFLSRLFITPFIFNFLSFLLLPLQLILLFISISFPLFLLCLLSIITVSLISVHLLQLLQDPLPLLLTKSSQEFLVLVPNHFFIFWGQDLLIGSRGVHNGFPHTLFKDESVFHRVQVWQRERASLCGGGTGRQFLVFCGCWLCQSIQGTLDRKEMEILSYAVAVKIGIWIISTNSMSNEFSWNLPT